jgi:8-oxo-dGTP pyrophosphatase MutT (NUDIX family)
MDEGETAIQTALRETLEESSINLNGYSKIHALPKQNYNNGKKDLQAFVMFEDENNFDFASFKPHCTSMVPAEKGHFPEIDDFKWVPLDELDGLIHMTQVASIPIIKEKLNQVRQSVG